MAGATQFGTPLAPDPLPPPPHGRGGTAKTIQQSKSKTSNSEWEGGIQLKCFTTGYRVQVSAEANGRGREV
jgi:hypothetical protein